MSESQINHDLRLELSRDAVRLFRNNVGVLQDRKGNYVRFGLCVGSSDLIGWKSIDITPEMVGRTLAVFVALETKSARGPSRDEQENFLRAVNHAGGVAGIVHSVDEARALLEGRHG